MIDLASPCEGQSALDLQRLSKEPFACAPLVLPIKMKLSSRMIDSRLPRKGRAIIFLPLLRRSYLSYEDTIERVQPGLSRWSGMSRGNVPHFVNSQRSWVATYLRVALTRMMLPILFAIRTPMKLIHSIASFIRYFANREANKISADKH